MSLLFFGQTLPELTATGKHAILRSLYILANPFLNVDLSSKFFLVPCGKITSVLLVFLITMNTLAVILRRRFERRW